VFPGCARLQLEREGTLGAVALAYELERAAAVSRETIAGAGIDSAPAASRSPGMEAMGGVTVEHVGVQARRAGECGEGESELEGLGEVGIASDVRPRRRVAKAQSRLGTHTRL
jgi:hypothetical protein